MKAIFGWTTRKSRTSLVKISLKSKDPRGVLSHSKNYLNQKMCLETQCFFLIATNSESRTLQSCPSCPSSFFGSPGVVQKGGNDTALGGLVERVFVFFVLGFSYKSMCNVTIGPRLRGVVQICRGDVNEGDSGCLWRAMWCCCNAAWLHVVAPAQASV